MDAGWFADPWKKTLLRWWDGADWTEHTLDGSALPPPPGLVVEEASHQLEQLLSGADRLAVVDVETTGLYNSDRVVEVAVVTIDRHGVVQDEFETLVNPRRDVGPTWLHQVTASMVAEAPTFDEVAQHIASRLDGAVCVAHNLPFDRRMLANEFDRAGIEVDWGAGFDTLTVTGCKLGVACDEHGVAFEGNAHSALADARATAALVQRVAGAFTSPGAVVTARPLEVTPMRVHTRLGRVDIDVPAPYLAALARGIHAPLDVAPYVDLLDAVVADLQITDAERSELASLAADLGLDDLRVARAHKDFVNGLIDAALEDHSISDAEHEQLCRAAALLGVDPELIARRTDGYRAEESELVLSPGMRVCFTGAAADRRGRPLQRAELEELAVVRGLVPVKGATAKGCDLLVAADPASRSGKAGKARQFGIPVVSVLDFLAAHDAGIGLAATKLQSAGVALVCTDCGASWLATRSSSMPLCADCKSSNTSTSAPKAEPTMELLICSGCGGSWEREQRRGRKPALCPSCG